MSFFVHNNTGDSMIIRLGYVSICKTLTDSISFHNLTYSNYSKNNENRLDITIKENCKTLTDILKFNKKNNIHFYRMTSNLLPLLTHKQVNKQTEDYKEYLNNVSKYILDDMRIDIHSDQFNVLNSTKKEVIDNTVNNLIHHYKTLKYLNIKNPIIILHVGSSEFGKLKSITRFINNFKLLPKYLQNSIVLENDDKIFNIKDVLFICKELNIPFVFDYHHYICNNDGENYLDYIDEIFSTWKDKIPKIHFSSPKNKTKKEFRSHHEYINVNDFIKFIEEVKVFDKDIDIMLEAKGKDEALFRLVRQLKYLKEYQFIDDTSFIVS